MKYIINYNGRKKIEKFKRKEFIDFDYWWEVEELRSETVESRGG